MTPLEQLTFNQRYCYGFAPFPPTADGIAQVLEQWPQPQFLIAYFFSQTADMYGPQTPYIPTTPQYNPANDYGGGLMDCHEDAHHLDFNGKLSAGMGFVILPSGDLDTFKFSLNTPAAIFTGLHRRHILNNRYNLDPLSISDFEDLLLPEDKGRFRGLRTKYTPAARVEAAQDAIFHWLVAYKNGLLANKK